MSSVSLPENMASIREGSSCRANARLIKRSRAGVEVEKQKESGNNQYTIRGGGEEVEGVPLSDAEVVAGSWRLARSPTPMVSSRGDFGTLRTPSNFWISSLCSSTLSLSYSMCGIFAPLLRVRSIPHITLGSLGGETDGP